MVSVYRRRVEEGEWCLKEKSGVEVSKVQL
jgi:hypothetical protein